VGGISSPEPAGRILPRMPADLPDGFVWKPVTPLFAELTVLVLGTTQVASIAERVDGAGWAVTVHRQREDHRARPFAIARDEAQAREWVTRWAVRDEALIRAEVAAYSAKLKL
jgi:hypothetical protein